MDEISLGDIVARKSYGRDVMFEVVDILKIQNEKIAILKGIIERIEADSKLNDLEKISQSQVEEKLKQFDENFNKKIVEYRNRNDFIKGRILHLDGDKKYTEKSYKYYRRLGLNVVVQNVIENKQPQVVRYLLKKYEPDILVITGHDSLLKKNRGYNNVNNYKNSKYFIETVKKARQVDTKNKIAIVAGACQSFYEGLILAGANFASSPGRILIDFTDPLIIAKKIANVPKNRYITIEDVEKELKNGRRGMSGIGTFGKMRPCNTNVT